ncbi:MAG: hypothetical protein WCD53_01805 [Microcoleus sp.]
MFNISSNSKDSLCAVLTNPTEIAYRKGNLKRHYPITDKTGKVWKDAEESYKHFKTGNLEEDMKIMTKIIVAKLRQYPEIVVGIEKRGGIEWLKSCSHIVGVKNSRWEGKGINSNFIKCLVNAYRIVTN